MEMWFETQSWYREERNVRFHVERGCRLKGKKGRDEGLFIVELPVASGEWHKEGHRVKKLTEDPLSGNPNNPNLAALGELCGPAKKVQSIVEVACDRFAQFMSTLKYH